MQIFDHIDRVGKKYGYNAELINALKRCVPAMIDGKTEKDIRLLMDTLDRVQIYTFEDQPNQEQIDDITNKKLCGRNSHVKTILNDRGEYGKDASPGAYVSEPVFDENMNIVDRVGFIYITNLYNDSETSKYYGTRINLSHLIHELGHAWGAQEGEYVQEENGDYTMFVGTSRFHNKVNRNTHEIKQVGTKGLYVEEALNSIEEENALYEMLGISDYHEIPGYVPSKYQSNMTDMMRHYIKKLGEEVFTALRTQKNRERLDPLQPVFDDTDFMKNINEGPYYKEKREQFEGAQYTSMSDEAKEEITNFFEQYRSLYFEPHQNQDFLDHLDRVMEQLYNWESIKYKYDICKADTKEAFNKALYAILKEGYAPVNQAALIIAERGKQQSIPPQVTLSYLAGQALKDIRFGEMPKEENPNSVDKVTKEEEK